MRSVDHRLALNSPALLSAPSKKSFSSVSSPIFACSDYWKLSRICSGGSLKTRIKMALPSSYPHVQALTALPPQSPPSLHERCGKCRARPLSFKLQRVANVPEHPPPSTRLMSCAHIANRRLSRIIGARGRRGRKQGGLDRQRDLNFRTRLYSSDCEGGRAVRYCPRACWRPC